MAKWIENNNVGRGGINTSSHLSTINVDESPYASNVTGDLAGAIQTRCYGSWKLGYDTEPTFRYVLGYDWSYIPSSCQTCPPSNCIIQDGEYVRNPDWIIGEDQTEEDLWQCACNNCIKLHVKFVWNGTEVVGEFLRENPGDTQETLMQRKWCCFSSELVAKPHPMKFYFRDGRLIYSNGYWGVKTVSFAADDASECGIKICQNEYSNCETEFCNGGSCVCAYVNTDPVLCIGGAMGMWCDQSNTSTDELIQFVYAHQNDNLGYIYLGVYIGQDSGLGANTCNDEDYVWYSIQSGFNMTPYGCISAEINGNTTGQVVVYNSGGDQVSGSILPISLQGGRFCGNIRVRYGTGDRPFNGNTEYNLKACLDCTANNLSTSGIDYAGYNIQEYDNRLWQFGDLNNCRENVLRYSAATNDVCDLCDAKKVKADFRFSAYHLNPVEGGEIVFDSGYKINALVEVNGQLYVHTTKDGYSGEIFVIQKSTLTNQFTGLTDEVYNAVHILSGNAAVSIESVLQQNNIQDFISYTKTSSASSNKSSVMSYGLFAGFASNTTKDTSYKIRGNMGNMNLSLGALGYWDRKEFISGAEINKCNSPATIFELDNCYDQAYSNNVIFFRDLDTDAWWRIDGLNVSLFRSKDRFYMGSSSSGDVWIYDYESKDKYGWNPEVGNFTYNDIKSVFSTKAINHSEINGLKKYNRLLLNGYISNDTVLNVEVVFDCNKRFNVRIDGKNNTNPICGECDKENNYCAGGCNGNASKFTVPISLESNTAYDVRLIFSSNEYFSITSYAFDVELAVDSGCISTLANNQTLCISG